MKQLFNYRSIVVIVLAFSLSLQSMFAGFAAGTLVKTPQGYTPIEQLQVGNQVVSYDFEGSFVACTITHTTCKSVSHYMHIVADDYSVAATREQRFYCAQECKWILARNITQKHTLLKNGTQLASITDLCYVDEAIDVYDITVEGHHNFCITHSDIHVHNVVPIVAIGVAFVFGLGSIELAKIGVAVGVGVGVAVHLHNKNKQRNIEVAIGPKVSAIGGPPEDEDERKKEKRGSSYPNGKYENAPYHTKKGNH